MMMRRVAALGLALSFISVHLTGQCHGQLQVGFYKGKCTSKFDVESIVRGVVEAKFITDKTITAALLRLHFHDCFVHVSFLVLFLFSLDRPFLESIS